MPSGSAASDPDGTHSAATPRDPVGHGDDPVGPLPTIGFDLAVVSAHASPGRTASTRIHRFACPGLLGDTLLVGCPRPRKSLRQTRHRRSLSSEHLARPRRMPRNLPAKQRQSQLASDERRIACRRQWPRSPRRDQVNRFYRACGMSLALIRRMHTQPERNRMTTRGSPAGRPLLNGHGASEPTAPTNNRLHRFSERDLS